jgi:hypothetical protein
MARFVLALRFAVQITGPLLAKDRAEEHYRCFKHARAVHLVWVFAGRLEKRAAADRFSGAVLVVQGLGIYSRPQQGVGEARGFSRPLMVMGWKLPSSR